MTRQCVDIAYTVGHKNVPLLFYNLCKYSPISVHVQHVILLHAEEAEINTTHIA